MRIGYDVRPFLKEETGVGVYFKNLLSSLSRIDHSNEYFLFSSSWKDRLPQKKIPPFTRSKFQDFRFPVKAVNFFWSRLGWPRMDTFFRTSLDLTHSPTPLVTPTGGKKIVTVHDLFFMDFPGLTEKEAGKGFARGIESSLRKADGVIAVSKFTKNQLLEKFVVDDKKIRVIYHGNDPRFTADLSPDTAQSCREKYSLPSSFLLFVGAIEPRKNLLNLVEALKIVHETYEKIHLVLIGPPGQDFKRLEKRIKQNKFEPLIRVLGYLPEEEVRIFYRLASVFVFPSLSEGFGLPLLESMASGLPVVTSKNSAIPEVVNDAALYVHPEHPEDIAEKIVLALKDEKLRSHLIERGKKRASRFDWKKAAEQTLDFYTEIMQRSQA